MTPKPLRHPLEMLRIVEEGELAERQYRLAEHLRDHNVTADEFERMRRSYTPQEPIGFADKDAALNFIIGNYDLCLPSIIQEALVEPESQKEEEKPMQAKKPKGGKRKVLDRETVELVAQDLIENPRCATSAIARRWDISDPSIYRIKWGQHPSLTQETKELLMATFGRSPSALPTIVPNLKTQEPPMHQVQQPTPSETPSAPAQQVQQRSPEPEVKLQGIVPRTASERQDNNRSLKEMLEEVRVVMERQGISHVSLPLNGHIVVQRTEVLV